MAVSRRKWLLVIPLAVILVSSRPVYLSYLHRVWSALDADDSASMEKCIKEGYPLDTAHLLTGETLLLRAVRHQRWECYQLLLESGANPNVQCGKLPVVVQFAAFREQPKWLECALKHGADPNLVNSISVGHGLSPAVFWAVSAHNGQNVRLLLDAGASPESTDEVGNTILAYAADFGMFSVVQDLIRRGADLLRSSRNGASLLNELKCYGIDFYGPSAMQEKNALMEVRKMVVGSHLCREEELTAEANIVIHDYVP